MIDKIINIVIVEDDPTYSESLFAVINNNDTLKCEYAFSNTKETIQYLEKHNDVDIVLLDIGLPDVSGIEAIEKIKLLQPDCSVVILTVYDDDDKIFEAICNGASGYLLKAESDTRILEAVFDIYQGGAFFTPTIASKILNFFSKKKRKYDLTKREIEVLKKMKELPTKKKIAEKLFISELTVVSHVKNIYKKLHVNCASQAVAKAIEEGLI